MKNKNLLALAAVVLGPWAASAQTLQINWQTIAGGGGNAGGGEFALRGTVGQPAAGALGGGAFTFADGFWAGAEAPVSPRPSLAIRRGAGHTVILSWPEPSTGYVLEETTNLTAGGGWTVVAEPAVVIGPHREVALPITGVSRLFRLRRS